MAIDRERRERVRQAVAWVRQHADVDDRVYGEDVFSQAKTPAEVIALYIAYCRAQGGDEVFDVEVLLRACDLPREMLLDIERVMAPLGYRDVAGVIRKLARSAPPKPPSFHQRVRAKMAAVRAAQSDIR
jgi:hypothetical protein